MADLFDIVVARKLSGGGGGGGSSDFSTATVTISNNASININLSAITNPISNHVMNGDFVSAITISETIGFDYYIDEGLNIPINSQETFVFYMINDSNFSLDISGFPPNSIALTGSASENYFVIEDSEIPCITITGDCTITIS